MPTIHQLLLLLILTTVSVAHAATPEADTLIRSICDQLNRNSSALDLEDRQWEWICRELYQSPDFDVPTDVNEDFSPKKRLRKAVRGSAGRVSGGGSRGSSGSRASSGASRASSSSSSMRYHSTSRGISYNRPSGWKWSRLRMIFLPLALRYTHRMSSSSSRFTTPTPGSTDYYYCTANDDPFNEIQCSTTSGDEQCCEETSTQEAFCCSEDVPDDLVPDMNRAARNIARVFYTIAGLALGMHVVVRRCYR